MSPSLINNKLPKIEVARSHKDVKAPRYGNSDFYWLYGLWLARGGVNGQKVYFSVRKDDADTINRITQIALSQFNLHIRLIDHSKFKYRIYLDSRSVGRWWLGVVVDPCEDCGFGIIEASSWTKANHLIVTCRKDKIDLLLPHLLMLSESVSVKARKNKNSCDLYLWNFFIQ